MYIGKSPSYRVVFAGFIDVTFDFERRYGVIAKLVLSDSTMDVGSER